MIFIILPHQLFHKKYLPKNIKKIILWEHPQYFTKYNFNKKKLILHRASMKHYYDYLKKNKYNIQYINFNKTPTYKKSTLFDPIDKIKIPNTTLIESPNFLLTKENYDAYKKKKGDSYMFHWFYLWGKKIVDIIPNVKSKDKENRKKLPKDIDIPDMPKNSNKKYIQSAIKYVNKHFKNNYGDTENFLFPISHATAKKWLKDFIKKRFENFGKYQDTIDKENDFLFHSYLSTSINIGLLNPLEIIDEIRKVKGIPMNSYEGYIRQLFWREYQRYCYIYYDFSNKNYFGNNKKITKEWYNGTTNIDPIDDCIKKGFHQGYLNHIQRLMVVGNFMNLSGMKPMDGFKWFMEFSCDSYEWVMYQNVLDMAFCVTGARQNGGTMAKPYISSSNYIIKMSNYKKGEWSEKWDTLYHDFIKNNKKKLLPFKYYFRFKS
tara:strand:+ start:6023 stop:7318 length:1296 start_codon:yes stop_codon:yes gene_type:complete